MLDQLSFFDLLSLDSGDGGQADSEQKDYAYRRLIGAVLIQAMVDAQAGDIMAIDWLKTDGEAYLHALGWGGVDMPALIEQKRRGHRVDFGIPGRGFIRESGRV